MQYDIFISYSRSDNTKNQVAKLVERIAKEFHVFAGRPLRPFFDTREISGGEFWQDKILSGLKDSRLMLACLSPAHLASQWCEWEFNEYQKYELARAFLGQGMAPVYFVQVPGFETADFETTCAKWVAELRRRQHYDLRPWHDEGETALQQADVAARLGDLTRQVWEQIRLGEMAEQRKGNLDRANERFVGRVQEMQRLHRLVGLGQVGVLTAVNGLGGIGKTALALQYAHAYGDTFAGGCWQASCEGKTDLREVFANLRGQRDMIYELTDDEKKSIDLQFERALRELHRRADAAREAEHGAPPAHNSGGNHARVLVILDNVDTPDLLADEQTRRLPRVDWLCLLATTRLGTEDLEAMSEEHFLAVDELPEDDALALIESYQPGRSFKDDTQRRAAREIVRLLGGMPLAVEVAAVFMGELKISCQDFLARLQRDGRDYFVRVESTGKGKVRHGEKCLAITLQPTLENLSAEERLALDYTALLPPDQVPLPWLRVLLAKEFPACGQDAEPGDPDPWLTVVRRLLSLRLVQATGVVNQQGFPLVVRMHRLLQEVVRSNLSMEEQVKHQTAVEELVTSRVEALEQVTQWHEARWELEPLEGLVQLWNERRHPEAAKLLNILGNYWRTLSEWKRAESLLRRSLEILEQNDRPANSDIARVCSCLAVLLLDSLCLSDEAEQLCRRSLFIFEQKHGSNHQDVALACNNLAESLRAKNRFSEAEPLYLQALAFFEQTSGLHNPNLAMVCNNLAGLLQKMNRYNEAESLFRRALKVYEESYNSDHPSVAKACNNLALILKGAGHLIEAELLYRRALSIWEKSYGPNHSDVGNVCQNLAGVLIKTNRLDEAESLLRRSLSISEQSYGPNHPAVAMVCGALSVLFHNLNRLDEAEPLYRRLLAIWEQHDGPAHPDTIRARNSLIELLIDMKRHVEADALIRSNLAILEQIHGSEHKIVGETCANLAQLLHSTHYIDEAAKFYRRAMAIFERDDVYGHSHANVAMLCFKLSMLLRNMQHMTEAELLARRALSIVLDIARECGNHHPNLQNVIDNYVGVMRESGKSAEEIIGILLEIAPDFFQAHAK
jgi:tetratricopeptide (TPR) repeat protein